MPSRVAPNSTREDRNLSESEKSFVSAESENTSNSSKGSFIDQSAAAPPSSPHHSIAPTNSSPSHICTETKSDSSDLIQGKNNELPSPLRSLKTPTSQLSGTYFALQPGNPASDSRSPQARRPPRPPASRSSHGIETKSGPPPALSTQRSYTESPWRSPPQADSRVVHSPSSLAPSTNGAVQTVAGLSSITNADIKPRPSKLGGVAPLRPSTSDGVMTGMEAHNFGWSKIEEDKDSTIRINGQDRQGNNQGRAPGQDSSQTPHEDLFLNLARDGSVVNEPTSRSKRRRTRMGTSSFSNAQATRPSSSGRPSTSGGSFGGYQTSLAQNHFHNSSLDSSFHLSPEESSPASFRIRPYAASAHPLEQRQRTRNNGMSFGTVDREGLIDEGTPETPMPYGSRRSIRVPSPGLSGQRQKQLSTSYTVNGNYGSSPFQSSSVRGLPAADGTESTVSTTAPSTVWDELDDLKSRLRKLELTGTLPKSSNAAMSNNIPDRPHTATTTVTTISSSPKRRQVEGVSPEASTIKTQGLPNLHPLLHSALAKAKPVLKAEIYQVLAATASDALSLAATSGGGSSQGQFPSPASIVGSASGIDKQLRRKADSLCRSLTELCIVLTEGMPEQDTQIVRLGSKGTTLTEVAPPTPRLLRAASDESDMRPSSRVLSRLEARRTSLAGSSPLNSRRESTQEAAITQGASPKSNRFGRTSTVNVRNRTNSEGIDPPDSRRPSSRAVTEVGQVRSSPQTRISREYTSQHPLPKTVDRSPSTQSALPMRKSYFPSATSSPLTPSVQPGHRRYLDRSTPPSATDSARLAEARQRRIASLGQGPSRISLSSPKVRQPESEQQRSRQSQS